MDRIEDLRDLPSDVGKRRLDKTFVLPAVGMVEGANLRTPENQCGQRTFRDG